MSTHRVTKILMLSGIYCQLADKCKAVFKRNLLIMEPGMYDPLGYKYGYSYTRKRDQMQVWRCVRRPGNGNECKGSAINDGKNYFSVTRPHACSPDINIAAKDAIIKEAKSVGRINLKTGGLHLAEEVVRGQHFIWIILPVLSTTTVLQCVPLTRNLVILRSTIIIKFTFFIVHVIIYPGPKTMKKCKHYRLKFKFSYFLELNIHKINIKI